MNTFSVLGRLGDDPLTKSIKDGTLVSEFRLAERMGKDRDGKELTQWHNIKCFGKTAEFVDKYLGKGLRTIVHGRVQYRQWEDRDGKRKYATDIIAERIEPIDWKDSNQQQSSPGGGSLDDIEF